MMLGVVGTASNFKLRQPTPQNKRRNLLPLAIPGPGERSVEWGSSRVPPRRRSVSDLSRSASFSRQVLQISRKGRVL